MIHIYAVLIILYVLHADADAATAQDPKLEFVQIVWRHGDRTPTLSYPNDPYPETVWKFSGGGFGQLTPRGMLQHVNFGRLLRQRYVTDLKFLSPYHDEKEVFFSSTDTGRTQLSALANIIGMYGDEDGSRKNLDYPNSSLWPSSLVPVHIHTDARAHYKIGDPFRYCPKYRNLRPIAHNSTEFREFSNRTEVQSILSKISSLVGKKYRVDTLWQLQDPLQIQKSYFDNFKQKVPWCTDEIYKNMTEVKRRADRFFMGAFEKPILYNGIDVRHEMQRLLGGVYMTANMDRIEKKVACLLKSGRCDRKIKDLKYHAFSAHDFNIYSHLVVLGIDRECANGLPDYTSAISTELYVDPSTTEQFFKIMFHENETSKFEDVTQLIKGCEKTPYCKIDILRSIEKRFRLDGTEEEHCRISEK